MNPVVRWLSGYRNPAFYRRGFRFGFGYLRWLSCLLSADTLPALAFLVLAAPLCFVMVELVPAGEGPDAVAQIGRADSLLHGELIGHREEVPRPSGGTQLMAGVDADPALIGIASLPTNGKLDLSQLQTMQRQPWSKSRFLQLPSTAVYMPLFYIPSALGLGAARWLGDSPFRAVKLARFANTIAFLALGAAALLVARRGRWLLFCVLTVPMTLFLASSAGQDGLLIAATVLAVALISCRIDPAIGEGQRWFGILAAILIAGVVAAKPPYLPIAAMLLLPLPPRIVPGGGRILLRRLGIGVLAVLPGLLWFWFAQRHAAVPLPYPQSYRPGPLWPGDPARMFNGADAAAQLTVLCADWTRVFALPVNQIMQDGRLLHEAIGVLGWLDVVMPLTVYNAWYAALLAALLAAVLEPGGSPRRMGWQQAALLVAASLLSLQLIYLSQYLSWTSVGADHIEGVQGRYLLPLMPVLVLALPQFGRRSTRAVQGALSLLPIGACLYQLALLPAVIVETWYLR